MNRYTNRSRSHTDPTPLTRSPSGTASDGATDTDTRTAKARLDPRRRLGDIARGVIMGGIAFLLGAAPLLFGASPLGLALLAASSSYTAYILGGLILSSLLFPTLPGGWGWVVIYLFCVGLRLLIRFYVDPPTAKDGAALSAGAYLRACLRSVMRRFPSVEEAVGPEAEDYYAGARGTAEAQRVKRSHSRTSAAPADKPAPRLLCEHPFLRMLTAGAAGFAAGLVTLGAGGFRLYDLLGLLFMIPATPLLTGLFIACFGEAGQSLLFSPTPLDTVRRVRREASASPASDGAATQKDECDGRFSRLMAMLARLEDTFAEDGGGRANGSASGCRSARGIERMRACYPLLPPVSVGALAASAVFAARTFRVELFGDYLALPLSALLALLLTLLCAARLGALPGVGSALVFGLASDARTVPMLMVTAVVYTLLRGLSHRAGVIGGCTAGAVYTAAVEGMGTLGMRLPPLILAIPLFLVIEKWWAGMPGTVPAHADPAAEELCERVSAALSAEARAKAQRARLEALSDALGGLSHRFYKLSGRLRQPRASEVRRLVAEALAARCAHCRAREGCRGCRADATAGLIEPIVAILHRNGQVDAADLPDAVYDLCGYSEELCADINTRYAKLSEALLHGERTDVCAADYAAMATLLADALAEDPSDTAATEENRITADRVYEYLSSAGVTVQGVAVTGGRGGRRRVIVQGSGMEGLAADAATVRAEIQDICGGRLALPTFETDRHEGVSVMTLSPEASLDVQFAGSTVPAGTSPGDILPEALTDRTPRGTYTPPAVCGDHIALFSTESACFYALISDGMGSGEEASLTSDICTMFLERMLAAGGRVEVSLRMLDSYLCAKNTGTRDECSATVDLMELDLVDGQAVFSKNGAAPTYVVRGGTVYKLRSRSMPMGILKGNDPRLLRFRMHPGDVVVMVSDGVTLGNDDCPWLIDLLSSPLPTSMDSLRADIIRRALTAGSEDDLSAIAIRVGEAR